MYRYDRYVPRTTRENTVGVRIGPSSDAPRITPLGLDLIAVVQPKAKVLAWFCFEIETVHFEIDLSEALTRTCQLRPLGDLRRSPD